ncbi:MAG TPA: hypothetical protein VFR77_09710 [Steroidobacteraceae bacterium]|nr:hypothetical protein [Steroidobacteraceae bacterium]
MIGDSSSAQIYFTVTNAGTGPAAIHSGNTASTPMAQTVLAPGTDSTVLRWPLLPDNQKLWLALDRVRQQNRIAMSACYCSVFDECWVADTHTFPPRQVASCEAGAAARSP